MEHALPPDGQEARVVDLRPRAAAVAARRLVDAEGRMAELDERVEQLESERDAAHVAARAAQADALAVRERLAARLAAETEALSAVAALRGQMEELRARAEARDARDAMLAELAGELPVSARGAREDVERHAHARAQAEAAAAAERRRVAEVEAALAAERERAAGAERALRAELDALRRARERSVGAEAEAQAARRAELAALTAARDRLRPPEPATAAPDGLILDLGRAAERLRAPRPSRWRRLV